MNPLSHNPLSPNPSVKPSASLTPYERSAIVKRLAQIAVAIGHPTWTAEQLATLVREQASLQRTLAADESLQRSTEPSTTDRFATNHQN